MLGISDIFPGGRRTQRRVGGRVALEAGWGDGGGGGGGGVEERWTQRRWVGDGDGDGDDDDDDSRMTHDSNHKFF